MAIKTILVPIDSGTHIMPSLEAAFILGRYFHAHVEVLHIRPDPKAAVPLLGEGMSGAMIEEMINLAERENDQRSGDSKTAFEEICKAFGVSPNDSKPDPSSAGNELSCCWVEETGREEESIARHGRLNDVVVCGRPIEGSEYPSMATLNAALFETGHPVLVTPPKIADSFGKQVAIAWNGSAEASRAVRMGLPFLVAADKVSIVTAETDKTARETADDLAVYLAWHGVNADPVYFSPAGHGVGEAMLLECGKVGADMLVMGAYTHSRVRQFILGGVTSHVLSAATIPVLMSH
ncbi:MAG: universal stress protein [Alphaproteobacteria bacterium]|nr:universal stress protein [Rhodospirillales bacterium]MCW9045990.1 universal stress protein [Alphaproteobacteria bacterium]